MALERIIHDAGWTVGYITDVEGNLAFWTKYVDYSAVLYRDEDGQLLLRDRCQFVFGGDSCDRGCGDLQVLRDLVSLKSRFFDRVHLLMGNRDINKLRFPVAMSPEILSLKPGCYFTNHSADIALDDDFQLNDPVSKIKWVGWLNLYCILCTVTQVWPLLFQYRFYCTPWVVRSHSNTGEWNCKGITGQPVTQTSVSHSAALSRREG